MLVCDPDRMCPARSTRVSPRVHERRWEAGVSAEHSGVRLPSPFAVSSIFADGGRSSRRPTCRAAPRSPPAPHIYRVCNKRSSHVCGTEFDLPTCQDADRRAEKCVSYVRWGMRCTVPTVWSSGDGGHYNCTFSHRTRRRTRHALEGLSQLISQRRKRYRVR